MQMTERTVPPACIRLHLSLLLGFDTVHLVDIYSLGLALDTYSPSLVTSTDLRTCSYTAWEIRICPA